MIFKTISPKSLAKKLSVFLNSASFFAKFGSQHWVLRKTPTFSPKIGENCDHNIDPDGMSYKTRMVRICNCVFKARNEGIGSKL
jgi:hypothetical protein